MRSVHIGIGLLYDDNEFEISNSSAIAVPIAIINALISEDAKTLSKRVLSHSKSYLRAAESLASSVPALFRTAGGPSPSTMNTARFLASVTSPAS